MSVQLQPHLLYLYFNYSINWWATVVSLHLAADLFFLPRLVFVNQHFWNGQYQSVILLNGNIVENLKWNIPLGARHGPDTRRSQPGDIWARELLSTAASHLLLIWNVGVIVVGSGWVDNEWILFKEKTKYFIFSRQVPSPFCMMRRPLASLAAWASTAMDLTISLATLRFFTCKGKYSVELSTNLRAVSQCLEKVNTRVALRIFAIRTILPLW